MLRDLDLYIGDLYIGDQGFIYEISRDLDLYIYIVDLYI